MTLQPTQRLCIPSLGGRQFTNILPKSPKYRHLSGGQTVHSQQGHASTLPDFVTISQGSQSVASQPTVQQITFADSHHANITVEPAQNCVDPMEVQGTSDLLTVPKLAYPPNLPSSTWTPEQLYEVRKRDTIVP